MKHYELSNPTIIKFSLLVLFTALLACPTPAQAVTFDLDYDSLPGHAPSSDSSGAKLTTLVEAAADVWSDLIHGGYEVRIQYQYERLDEAPAMTTWHVSTLHWYDSNGNGVNDSTFNRVYNVTIKIDPDVNWYVDPTPLVNDDYGEPVQVLYRSFAPGTPDEPENPAYRGTPPDLLEAGYYMVPDAGTDPASGRDLYTTVLHEFGHAVGFNSSSIDASSPYRLVQDKVWDYSVFAYSERGHGDQNEAHIDTPHALMSYNRDLAWRYYPSATDLMTVSKFAHWGTIDMPRKDFVDADPASSPNYWSHSRHWTGDRVPDAEDEVFIRNGAEAILNLTDGVAKVLTISEDARLIIRGDRTLTLQDLMLKATGTLEISSAGASVAFIDSDGAPLVSPIIRTPGSIELGWNANQAFHRLTIHDEDSSDAITPHLNLENNATLTLADHLQLENGAESRLSDSTIVFTNPIRSLFRLNGRMTLEDESSMAVLDMEMLDTGGISPQLSILSGSTFEVLNTDGAINRLIPAGGSITISDADSSLTIGSQVTAEGALSLSHGTATIGNLRIESTGTLAVRHGGLLDISAGELYLKNGSDITISDIGTLVRADSIVVATPVNIAGAARLETSTLTVNAGVGTGFEAYLELNGAGPVLTTDNLIFESRGDHAARVDHNFGIVTINNDMEIRAGTSVSEYTISDGSATVDGHLRMLADSQFVLNLNGGTFNLARIDQQGNAAFTLNLDGGTLHMTGLGVHEFDTVNVAHAITSDVTQTLQDREFTFNNFTVGVRGNADLTMRGPTTVNNSMILGAHSPAASQFTFDPASEFTTLSAGTIIVGQAGHGTFIQTNGFVSVDPSSALSVGRGSYQLQGGNLISESAQIGTLSGHSSSFLLQGGRHDVGELKIGLASSTATYQIDSGRLDADEVIVTDTLEGTFVQNNGTSRINGNMVLGNINGIDATATLNDGSMTVVGELQIAKAERGRGRFIHNSGSLTVRSDLHVGYGVDSVGAFSSYDSMDVAGDLIIGSGEGSEAMFQIVGSAGVSPILDITGGVRIAGAPGSTADFHITGSGLDSPTLWLTDQDIDVGPGGTGILHMAGGRIRAPKNLSGEYDSGVHIHPGNSVQGYGRIDIPVDNMGAIINSSHMPLSFTEAVSGEGVVRAEAHPGTGMSGRIEFWGLGKIQGAMICDGTIVGLGLTDSLEIRGGIHGEGQLDAVGNVDLHSPMDVARVNVSGHLTQHAHDAAVDELRLTMGTYTLNGGTLETTVPVMGGTFEQMGGETHFTGDLTVGSVEEGFSGMGDGTLLLDDGSLLVSGDMQLGIEPDPIAPMFPPAWGTVRFTSEKPHVEVAGDLIITAFGRLETVPGATIHLTGSNVYNTSQDPLALAGLSDLQLSFAGDGSVLDTFEVAGDPTGDFVANFTLGQIKLGGMTRLQLVDLVDNGNRASGDSEALFLKSFLMSGTATLDLNGLSMFVQGDISGELLALIDAGRIFNSRGGLPEYHYDSTLNRTEIVPEPSVLMLLLPGLLSVIRRRRRRT
ncbi:MAG: hypothetical protein HN350_01945 [Phycisphaerales bacterium]|jgi:hypothetical protein|nr:hypothetical protein [Phycisphaerales bacterium]